MRNIEKRLLREYTAERRAYERQHTAAADFAAHSRDLTVVSLQAASRAEDGVFLGDISRIISVIMSIVGHPHMSNRREEIVARIERVKQLSNEEFTRVIRESSFWKKRGLDMVPEQVYYYQHVDELVIYENQFICLLVNLIEGELLSYADFYLAMTPTLSEQDSLAPANEDLAGYLENISRQLKRIGIIKSTRFYKEISKRRPIGRNVQRTNILIHDNLYKQCYIFYRRHFAKTDERALAKDLRNYYLTWVLERLVARGFGLVGEGAAKRKRKWIFENKDFRVSVGYVAGACALNLDVRCKGSGRLAKHLLWVSSSLKRDDVPEIEGAWDSVDVLSLWSLVAYEQNEKCALISTLSESQLIDRWLDSKLTVIKVDPKLYARYCPVCKGAVQVEEREVHCRGCGSKYRFLSKKSQMGSIWLVSRRRIEDGK